MEACMMKPEVRKKRKPYKPPPKPTERPTPVAPQRPTDAELSHTQYRMKISAALNEKSNDRLKQQNIKVSEAPVVPLRPAEKIPSNPKVSPRTDKHRKRSRGADRSEAFADEVDFRRSDPPVLPGMFRQSQKEKMPTFVRYVIDDEEEKADVSIKASYSNKPAVLKGTIKGLQLKSSSKASIELSPDPGAGETRSEREQPVEENTQQNKKELKMDVSSDTEVPVSKENVFESKQESGGLFSGSLKKTPRGEKTETPDRELSASSEDLSENNKEKTGLTGMFRSASLDDLFDEDKNVFTGIFKKTPKSTEEQSNTTAGDKKLFDSSEDLSETNTTKEKTGRLAGIFKKSPKPAPRSVVTQDPLSDSKRLSSSCNSLTDIETKEVSAQEETSASNNNLSDATKEKRVGFSGNIRWTPKISEQQEGEKNPPPTAARLICKGTVKKKKQVVSFRIRKIQPKQSPEIMAAIEEAVELQDLNAPQESTVVVEPVEMAAYPSEETSAEAEQENNELMEWWNTVKGWTEWNEMSDFQEDEEMAMELVADRVYMAARVFVHLFNQRGASLQQRILELLAAADAADEFHKKTVSAAVGGGVASVCGSLATITGLILAPFTFGASVIVTAVGISVATAGSLTSATAKITDTVHSNMDRKRVEKMIQGYQEEIKDIRLCLEFVQEGMDTLQDLDFQRYSEGAAQKALNHNIKHVMKEGGRAGKALMINTEKLISTVQVLGGASGVAKAARAISVTTGVISALFLALDVFFLAKDSHELRKGAKTKFAGKIRQVCKELQEGLLELNKVKTQLQKIMDGIEVEEYEEIQEVEEELESDPKKLAELEQEIDILEEKLDKKGEEEKKSKEAGWDLFKLKKEKKEERSGKEKEVQENSLKSKSQKTPYEKEKFNDTTKEEIQTGKKSEKEMENQRQEETERRSREEEGRPTSSRSNKDETQDTKNLPVE